MLLSYLSAHCTKIILYIKNSFILCDETIVYYYNNGELNILTTHTCICTNNNDEMTIENRSLLIDNSEFQYKPFRVHRVSRAH